MSETCNHDCSSCSQSCESRDPKSFLEKPHEKSTIRKVIGVVSGKGGVGKSMVSSSRNTGSGCIYLGRVHHHPLYVRNAGDPGEEADLLFVFLRWVLFQCHYPVGQRRAADADILHAEE